MLGERRGGRTSVYNKNGSLRFRLELGDASEDIQTTPNGLIWVSYFDEGVFGGGVGEQGLVCFGADGEVLFKYADFAEQNTLPMICDCYAINVDAEDTLWLNYYIISPWFGSEISELRRFGTISVFLEKPSQYVVRKSSTGTKSRWR